MLELSNDVAVVFNITIICHFIFLMNSFEFYHSYTYNINIELIQFSAKPGLSNRKLQLH